MTFKEVYEEVKDIEGWMGEEDCEALYNAVKDLEGLIVEIGPYAGRSTKVLALASKAKVIAIDSYNFVNDMKGVSNPSEIKKMFLKNVKGLNVELIHKASQVVKWNKEIDFLHIDGNHSYRIVKKDILNFVPHVRKGHYVYFHDYVTRGSPGEIISKRISDGKDAVYYKSDYGVVRAIHELGDLFFDEVNIVSGFAACRKK